MSELTDCTNSLTAKDIIRAAAKTANGVPFYINVLGLSSYCAEFQAVLDAYVGTIPDAIQLAAQNTMVCGLVEDGTWAKLDTFWVMANGDSPNCDLNWVNPGTFTLTPVNAPLFDAWEGYTCNGVDEYIDTNWIPSVNGAKFTLNDAACGIYIRNNVSEASYDFGCVQAPHWLSFTSRYTGSYYLRINDSTALTAVTADSSGFWIGSRTLVNHKDLYRNKGLVDGHNFASVALPNVSIFIGAYNSVGIPAAFSTRQYSLLFLSSKFVQADVDSMTDRFETYMDALGNGVIP